MRFALTCCLLLALLVLPTGAQEPPKQVDPVPEGKLTLTIDPGVTLRFKKGGDIQIEHFSASSPASGALRRQRTG